MMNSIPNTFIIGAQKSGTSTIHNWLKQHPDVYAPESAKDFPFFTNSFFEKGEEYFHSFYKKSSNTKIVINGYAHYLFEKEVPERIKNYNSRSKLIVVLRKPIDRIVSSYLFSRKRGLEDSSSIEEALDKENDRLKIPGVEKNEYAYLANSQYASGLTNYLDYFNSEDIHIVLFDDIVKTPQDVYTSLCNFLQIDTSYSPSYEKVNETGTAKFPWINRILYKKYKFKVLIAALVPLKFRSVIRRKAMRLNTTTRKDHFELNPSTRKDLIGKTTSDVKALSKLINRDLDHWLK